MASTKDKMCNGTLAHASQGRQAVQSYDYQTLERFLSLGWVRRACVFSSTGDPCTLAGLGMSMLPTRYCLPLGSIDHRRRKRPLNPMWAHMRASYSGCVCLHPVVAAWVRSGRPCLQAWCANAIVERWQNNADFVTIRLSSALDERTLRLPIALQKITVRVSSALAVCRSRSPIANCLSPMHSASNAYTKCTRQDSGASVDCTR